MKVTETKNVIMDGMGKSVVQSISAKNISRATYFLRDRIYTDKLKAAICEPICNAVDEHRKHNIARPVDIFILADEIVIRDYANGLDDNNLYNIFFQYFESTKDKDNNGIGGFGIGAKAPGAYADTYYVESYYNGTRSVFVSTVQGYDAVVNKLLSEPCAKDNSGIAVRIPYKKNDMSRIVTLLEDMYVLMGADDEKSPIHIFRDLRTATYMDIGQYTMEQLCTDVERLHSVLNTAGIEHDRIVCNGSIVRRCRRSPLQYHMFSGHNILFYDGDMAYSATLTDEQQKLISKLQMGGEYHQGYYHEDFLFIRFKRGTLQIAPSREYIEQSPKLTTVIRDTVNAILAVVKDKAKEEFNTYRESEQFKPWNEYNHGHIVLKQLFNKFSSNFSNGNIGSTELWQKLFISNSLTGIGNKLVIRRFESVYSASTDRRVPYVNKLTAPVGFTSYQYRELSDSKYIVIGMDLPMVKVANAIVSMNNWSYMTKKRPAIVQVASVDTLIDLLHNNSAINEEDVREVINRIAITTDELKQYINEDDDFEEEEEKPKKKKPVQKHLELPTGVWITEDQYSQTLIVKKSEQLNKPYPTLHNGDGYLFDEVSHLTGLRYLAPVDAGDIEYWKRRGAKTLDVEKLKKSLAKLILKAEIVELPYTYGIYRTLSDFMCKVSNSKVCTDCRATDAKVTVDNHKYSIDRIYSLAYVLLDPVQYSLPSGYMTTLYNMLDPKIAAALIQWELIEDRAIYSRSEYGEEAWKVLMGIKEAYEKKIEPHIKKLVKTAVKQLKINNK